MNNQEALLCKIIDLFAERFDKHAILRGGMVLRVLGCERLTNDLDYVFVPFKSKKDVVLDVVSSLESIEGAEISYSLNSKCLRVVVKVGDTFVQVEAKTALDISTNIISTKNFAARYGLPPRLIRVVDYPMALADKMAAWNERRLIRDLYDIWFYLKMGVHPDPVALEKRLAKPVYSKFVKKADRFQGEGIVDFLAFLNSRVQTITDRDIMESLSDYLVPEEMPGLSMQFRAEIAKFVANFTTKSTKNSEL